MADEYRYASVEDVPLTGPDPYSPEDKTRAIEAANGRLEADTNDGARIADPEEIHTHAVAAYATYVLAIGPKAPDNATMGDLADEGPRRMNFAESLRQIYLDCVESIVGSGEDEGGGDWPVYVKTASDY